MPSCLNHRGWTEFGVDSCSSEQTAGAIPGPLRTVQPQAHHLVVQASIRGSSGLDFGIGGVSEHRAREMIMNPCHQATCRQPFRPARLAAVVLIGLLCGGSPLEPAGAEPPARSKFNREVAVGDDAPVFEGLLGIDGRRHSLTDYQDAPVVVVMFLRNLCPTTHAYESRLRKFATAVAGDKVQVVAISVSRNPAEGLDRMAVRARDKQYVWPYLLDDSQFTGRQYGATVTPQFFVLNRDRKIAYMGAFDDDVKGTAVKRQFVAEAVRNLLSGKPVDPVDTLAKGCEIEYAK